MAISTCVNDAIFEGFKDSLERTRDSVEKAMKSLEKFSPSENLSKEVSQIAGELSEELKNLRFKLRSRCIINQTFPQSKIQVDQTHMV